MSPQTMYGLPRPQRPAYQQTQGVSQSYSQYGNNMMGQSPYGGMRTASMQPDGSYKYGGYIGSNYGAPQYGMPQQTSYSLYQPPVYRQGQQYYAGGSMPRPYQPGFGGVRPGGSQFAGSRPGYGYGGNQLFYGISNGDGTFRRGAPTPYSSYFSQANDYMRPAMVPK